MMYLMIVFLLAVLAGLLWWQHQQDLQWHEELAQLQNPQKAEKTPPENPVATEIEIQMDEVIAPEIAPESPINLMTDEPQPLVPNTSTFPFKLIGEHEVITLADAARNVQAAKIAQKAAEKSRIVLTDLSGEPDLIDAPPVAPTVITPDAQVIDFEEATEHLMPHLPPRETTVIVADDFAQNAENLEEMAIEDETPLAKADIPHAPELPQIVAPEADWETETLADFFAMNALPTASQEADPEAERIDLKTIELNDIQESLSRQQAAYSFRQQKGETVSGSQNAPKIIAQNEVLANLVHHLPPQDAIPSVAQSNRKKRVAVKENSVVTLAAPVVAPVAPLPDPEIAAPVKTNRDDEEAFAADFFAPRTVAKKVSLPENRSVVKSVQAAVPQSEPELSKVDFAEYYAEQESKLIEWAQWNNEVKCPPLDLLLPPIHNSDAEQSPEALLENSITIEEKLAEYRVKVKVLDAYAGPVITRYEIEPDVGVRGNSVLNLEKDLARSLGVASIRVVETIPGKTCMGLELPNPKRQIIRLREIFDSQEFSNSKSQLTLALGQDISGKPVVTDLAKAPHLLVAGTTGSGKSVGVNAMILSMLYKASPEDVRMIMIDPKMLELSIYEGIPHLLAPVVTDMKLAQNALNWCVNEMEKRYRLMSHVGVRNLAGYNEKIQAAAARGKKIGNPFSFTPDDPEPLEKLPYIVVIVDEFADLMMVAGKQIEQLIARLAQKARAAGIHLILATQRPSVDVITGLIKANIPTRIAFQVSSKIDSRTILDQMGAENLLGQGDMLFLPPGTSYPQRVHGAFVADDEVHRVVDFLQQQFGEPDYVDDILTPEQGEFGFDGSGSGERDELFDAAVDVLLRTKKASISSLQRQLRIGYNKAATIMEQMEEAGMVSAADQTGKRTILARSIEN